MSASALAVRMAADLPTRARSETGVFTSGLPELGRSTAAVRSVEQRAAIGTQRRFLASAQDKGECSARLVPPRAVSGMAIAAGALSSLATRLREDRHGGC